MTHIAIPLSAPRTLNADNDGGVWCNDIHSKLNRARVRRVHWPTTVPALQEIVRGATRGGRTLATAAGRHAMGGQQFAHDVDLVDMSGLDRVVDFDRIGGIVEVEAGIQWPALIDFLVGAQEGEARAWSIRQKQTGADRLSIGGALAANVHGRSLAMRPIVGDVEDFTLVDATGALRCCSRDENADLFACAIGGYGLFGVIATVRLRLMRRRKLERVVEMIGVDTLAERFAERIADGYLYGDFQYSTAAPSDTFLRRGVFACYRPVDSSTPMPADQRELSEVDWTKLLHLGHVDKQRAYDLYTSYYLASSGQIYWSDTHQLSTYRDDYHADLDRTLGADAPGSEMISEIFVPRPALASFMSDVAVDFRRNDVDVVYGTVRLIEPDDETFLAWAREPFACVIFNLHVDHTPSGIDAAARHFRRLIDHGRRYGGSYYLTYHRWASREQLLACYPQFPKFLRLKRRRDPGEVFQSDWYRHYKTMLADLL